MDESTIKRLEKGGFIRAKFRDYENIFKKFTEIRKGSKYEDAVEATCEECHVSARVVQRAVADWKRMLE